MPAAPQLTCPRCRRAQSNETLVCALCGELLGRAPRPVTSVLPNAAPADVAARTSGVAHTNRVNQFAAARTGSRDSTASHDHTPPLVSTMPLASTYARSTNNAVELDTDIGRTPWIYLAIGLATAPVFAWTPILQYMGWFLSSLVHEMGHAAFAWLCGMPAMPAISLGGHAMAMHGEQMLLLVVMIVAGSAFAAWRCLHGRVRVVALVALGVVYPVLAFTPAKELFHLLAGHGGELVFATLCLWKTLDGGFTESRVERALYGTVGWYLLGSNAALCLGLMSSAVKRAEYGANGSFGLTNDMIRAAEDVLGWRLESVALLMFVACLAVLPVAIVAWRVCVRLRRA
jgi:hypothetical protein